MDALKDIDFTKVALWVLPGAFIMLARSFFMRGSFPRISKDDIAALILGSVCYFLIVVVTTGLDATSETTKVHIRTWEWLLVLIFIPVIIGASFGILEVSDVVGRFLRRTGIQLPSPHPTAWETMFHEIGPGTVLLITLKDGSTFFGRWNGSGKGGSASSTDATAMDLYLNEIGIIDEQGQYVSKKPRRGVYISASEIRFIEIIPV